MRFRALVASVAALMMATGPALAFQQEPAAPAPEAPTAAVVPESSEPGMQLQTPSASSPAEHTEKQGAKIFGFNVLPKLDFGLELLYSNQPHELQQLPQTQLEEQSDLTVFGKVRRQF